MSFFSLFLPVFFVGILGLANITFPKATSADSPLSHPLNKFRINLAKSDIEKAEVKIGILLGRISDLEDDDYSDTELDRLQSGTLDVISSVGSVLNSVRERKAKIDHTQTTQLLLDTYTVLVRYQDYIQAKLTEVDSDITRSKLLKTRDRANALSHLVKSDQEDIKDDGVLNGSVISAVRVTIAGKLSRDGSILNVKDDKKYHVVASPNAITDTIVATDMRIDGVIVGDNVNQLTVFKIEPGREDEKDAGKELEGRVVAFGEEYLLVNNDGVFILFSNVIDFTPYVGKKVVVNGTLSKDTINLQSIHKSLL